MKLQEECLPCIVNQAIKVADMVGIKDKNDLLKEMFRYLSSVDFSEISSPELSENITVYSKESPGIMIPTGKPKKSITRCFLKKQTHSKKKLPSQRMIFWRQ